MKLFYLGYQALSGEIKFKRFSFRRGLTKCKYTGPSTVKLR